MVRTQHFFIDGAWVAPLVGGETLPVVDPSTEEVFATIAIGTAADVDRAVIAARRAFPAFASTPTSARVALLERIGDVLERRLEEVACAISREMGAPITLARQNHVPSSINHFRRAAQVLAEYWFDTTLNTTRVTREPIGVCGLITPWNWPLNQIACKIAPALASGCTIILKPSEFAPISALILAEILDEAGVPPGVFNLVNGDGAGVGDAIARHTEIDMVSFTGSTRAGIMVAKAAADTVKRVTQELGGKSPSILLDDADIAQAVAHSATACFRNSGQSCNAPTRLLVPRNRQHEAAAVAAKIAADFVAGPTKSEATLLGPVANAAQFARVNALIEAGIQEGANLVAGGLGLPDGLTQGYFVRPTVFDNVSPGMIIAREEIFGPVLSIIPYNDEDAAISIANDTVYGLSAYVTSSDIDRARAVARRIRAGMVHINGARADNAAAFGGYKQSGNGREWGVFGFEEFLEIKSMFGYEAA
ncbi:aldehyde dehydrogenase family protein [Sphingosinicella sp.]|uniref:aldehyde dehydrogenase family protein n=1 Tax=Sphingosinicella sp. TaxID=1917971 RepID=UPI0035B4BFCE